MTPTISQVGTVPKPAGAYTFSPGVGVNSNGAIGLTYMQMSENERPSAYVTGRLASDPIGSMQTPVRMKAGETVAGSTFDAEVIARLTAVSYRGAIAVDPNGTQFRLANGYTKAVQPTGLYFAFWGTWVQGFNVATTQANIRVIDAYLTESPGESAVKHSPGDAGLSPG